VIRVLVVDDHALVRSGVRAEMGDDVEVVGEAGDVASALAAVRALTPDVVLLDVHLPGGGGRAVLEAAVPEFPAVRFLALSVSDAAQDVIAVIRAGARGYVTKAITGADLRAAIRQVNDGDACFSPYLAGFVLDAFRGDPDLDGLTPRERDVLRLVAAGYTYREVGERLSISGRTVETHAAAVLRKLQLPNRRALSRWARSRF
jgi:DNA-binding NarL/FixJ family response regulator